MTYNYCKLLENHVYVGTIIERRFVLFDFSACVEI